MPDDKANGDTWDQTFACAIDRELAGAQAAQPDHRDAELERLRAQVIDSNAEIASLSQQLASYTPKCPTCGGNDSDAPCAYPSEGKPGCLRDKRLAGAHERERAPVLCSNCAGTWFKSDAAGRPVCAACDAPATGGA
jgi:hypothetical protein